MSIPLWVLEKCKNKNIKIVSEEYDSKGKVSFICILHPNLEVQIANWYTVVRDDKGNGCKKCANKSRQQKRKEKKDSIYKNHKNPRKYNIEIAKELFKNKGGNLKTKEYKNTYEDMEFECPIHIDKPTQKTSLNNVLDKRTKRICKYCINENKKNEKNPNWKGGITSEVRKIRLSEEYADWRTKVFERDCYTCQACGGERGGELEAHHIKSFAYYKELRFEVDNGITLCKFCHNPEFEGSLHNIFGTDDTTEEELLYFLHKKRKEQNIDIEKIMKMKKELKEKGIKKVRKIKNKQNLFSLSDKEVLEIIDKLSKKQTQKSLAIEYGVSQSLIGRIKRGEAYEHLNLKNLGVRIKLSFEQVREIRERLKKGESAYKISLDKKYNVCKATILSIKNNKSPYDKIN